MNTGTYFYIEPDDLEQVATRLKSLAGFLDEQLDEYDAKIAALRATHWSGSAADAFGVAQSQWATAARTFVTAVMDAGEELDKHRAAFLRAQSLNTQMFGGK
ncbi:WXG100 family type VII secretion target [Nocardia fluminea]|uniref:WXG100 family type VII secretion target n=1 Tax=Nocardia fluminea TaxID=134984 RepID=UPI003441EC3D